MATRQLGVKQWAVIIPPQTMKGYFMDVLTAKYNTNSQPACNRYAVWLIVRLIALITVIVGYNTFL